MKRTSHAPMLGIFTGLILPILALCSSNAVASCSLPEPDLTKATDTPPALVAYITKMDLHKGKVELKSKSGTIYTLWAKDLEGKLVSGYGGLSEVKRLQVGYELKIWQADCLPISEKQIKPVHVIYMKPSWYENKD